MSEVIRVRCVSALPLNPAGKILLQQRDDRPTLIFPGYWTAFGGAVEAGETLDEALRRELLEEIELELPMKLWKVDDFHMEGSGQTLIIERNIYTGRIDRAASEIKLNEGQALGYFGLADLHSLKIGFDFERVFREFFAALADGTLPLD
jgi:8-oxo-dGTP pyrophosphatase MutT (NUDIX family)